MNQPAPNPTHLLSSNTPSRGGAGSLSRPVAVRGAPITPPRKGPSSLSGRFNEAPSTAYFCPRCRVGHLTTARGLGLSAWVLEVWIAHHGHGLVEQYAGIVAPMGVR